MSHAAAAAIGTVLSLSLSLAQAASLGYTATALGGNQWRYDYTLDNSTTAPSFHGLTLYFDDTLYDLLTDARVSAGWDLVLVQPDVALPAAGLFDALRLDGPVGDSAVVTGLSVSVRYLGIGTPGAQLFELYDGLEAPDFTVVQSGFSVPLAPVDEPPAQTLALLGMALGLAWQSAKHRRAGRGSATPRVQRRGQP